MSDTTNRDRACTSSNNSDRQSESAHPPSRTPSVACQSTTPCCSAEDCCDPRMNPGPCVAPHDQASENKDLVIETNSSISSPTSVRDIDTKRGITPASRRPEYPPPIFPVANAYEANRLAASAKLLQPARRLGNRSSQANTSFHSLFSATDTEIDGERAPMEYDAPTEIASSDPGTPTGETAKPVLDAQAAAHFSADGAAGGWDIAAWVRENDAHIPCEANERMPRITHSDDFEPRSSASSSHLGVAEYENAFILSSSLAYNVSFERRTSPATSQKDILGNETSSDTTERWNLYTHVI